MNKPNNKNEEIYFTIKQVAKQIYIVPATLRNWEKAGLIKPKRLSNNYRVYTLSDLDLLKKIRTLSMDESMTMSAIKNLLYGDSNTSPYIYKNDAKESIKYSQKLLNSKWKASREVLNMSIEDVCKETGIDPFYIESIENGTATIDIDKLSKLAMLYGESILYFFEIDDIETADSYIVRKGKGEVAEIGLEGVRMESLVRKKNHVLFPMHFTVQPGGGSSETHRHKGEEYLYIIRGELQVIINYDLTFTLKKGDSMYFKSNEYHYWKNVSTQATKLIWVHSPVETN
ncbi:MAG: cupin domain-containing protein [Anaerotignum sp.]|nr:cupin domain-containing protein [Anaerotignum sp.]